MSFISALRQAGLQTCISIDTDKSLVARAAIAAGANIINDISAGRHDEAMIATAAEMHTPMIFMHMRGDALTMNSMNQYTDLVRDVADELDSQLSVADTCIPLWHQWVDPGVGFAKNAEQNLQLLRPSSIRALRHLWRNRPMVIGVSRKRFLKQFCVPAPVEPVGDLKTDERNSSQVEDLDWSTAGMCCAAVAGGAEVLRVHNVRGIAQACRAMKAVLIREES